MICANELDREMIHLCDDDDIDEEYEEDQDKGRDKKNQNDKEDDWDQDDEEDEDWTKWKEPFFIRKYKMFPFFC